MRKWAPKIDSDVFDIVKTDNQAIFLGDVLKFYC